MLRLAQQKQQLVHQKLPAAKETGGNVGTQRTRKTETRIQSEEGLIKK